MVANLKGGDSIVLFRTHRSALCLHLPHKCVYPKLRFIVVRTQAAVLLPCGKQREMQTSKRGAATTAYEFTPDNWFCRAFSCSFIRIDGRQPLLRFIDHSPFFAFIHPIAIPCEHLDRIVVGRNHHFSRFIANAVANAFIDHNRLIRTIDLVIRHQIAPRLSDCSDRRYSCVLHPAHCRIRQSASEPGRDTRRSSGRICLRCRRPAPYT